MDNAMTWLLWLFLSFISPAHAQCNGVFSANTTCGSVAGGPPGQVSFTTTGFTFSGIVSQPATNLFFSGSGGIINRVNDRIFIAGATPNTGASPNTNADWLSTYSNSIGGGNYITNAQGAILNNNNAGASISWVAAVHTSNFTGINNALANVAIAVNDNTTIAENAWAFYGECHKANNTVSGCYGMELDPANHGSAVAVPDPYTQGTVVGIQDACGAGLSGLNPCSAAIQIVNNTATFGTGINIISGSISPAAGAGNITAAITLPASYHILWDTAAATFGGSITVTPSKFFVQKASGEEWQNSSGTNIFDCNVTTTSACTLIQRLDVDTGGGNAINFKSGSQLFWNNSSNTDSFDAFNSAGTWTFQHNASTIATISNAGLISANGGVQVNNASTVGWLNSGNVAEMTILFGNSGLQFQFNFGSPLGFISTTGDMSGFAGLDATPIGATTSAAASITTLTLSTATFGTFSTGAGTQTFTNSPCGVLTTERWLPIKITGSSSTFFVPACS